MQFNLTSTDTGKPFVVGGVDALERALEEHGMTPTDFQDALEDRQLSGTVRAFGPTEVYPVEPGATCRFVETARGMFERFC